MLSPLSPPCLPQNRSLAFATGVGLPLHGAKYLLTRPRLWPLVLIPLALNLLLFVGLLFWGFREFAQGLEGWLGDRAAAAWYWRTLAWTIQALFWIVVLAVVYFLFTPAAILIASPFNDRIAEQVERDCGLGIQDHRPLWRAMIEEAAFSLLAEAKRMLIFGAAFLLLLPLNLLPLVGNGAYIVLAFLLACFGAAFEFSSYAPDRRHWPFRKKWAFLRAFPSPVFGFGLATFGLMLVPFLNVLLVPVSAVGGTMLFCMLRNNEINPSERNNSWTSNRN